MPPASHFEHVQRSREEILGAIGEHPDLVLIRGYGNRGDELIWAGTRELLEVLVYREIGIEELPGARGHTALICGGGAFCRSFHELMPHVLAMAELRFERVIVLPSSFDTSVDVVRAALRRSRALVFAREQESYRRIQPLCEARLAHDCAFFYDFSPYWTAPGKGTLNVFRSDGESTGEHAAPPDNDDISITAESMDAWLRRIAAHELIRTDRAHVMIAAAMLDKRVEFVSGSYFKVPAIAEYALSGFPVTRLEHASAEDHAEHALARLARLAPIPCSPDAKATRERLKAHAEALPAPRPNTSGGAQGAPRVTAVVLSHERPEMALGAIHSVIQTTEQAGVPASLLVIDNNSSERTRRILSAACGDHPSIELRFSDRDLGLAGGRGLALELATSELVLFLDEAAELMPGALARLLSEFDRHPDTYAVGATVLLPDGRISHSGGWYRESRDLVHFTLAHAGSTLEQGELPPSGACDWIPGTAALVRRSLFEQFPLDPEMGCSCDAEWCLRVADAHPGRFRRCREALVLHHTEQAPLDYSDLRVRARVVETIATAARFYRRHRRLLRAPDVDPFSLLPGLVSPDGTLELAGARILMELASAHDGDWLLMEWMNGGLDPLLRSAKEADRGKRDAESLAALNAQLLHARKELESAGRQLDNARVRIDAAQEDREEAWRRLERIYRSRLWRLGVSYDRARRGVRTIRSLGGRG